MLQRLQETARGSFDRFIKGPAFRIRGSLSRHWKPLVGVFGGLFILAGIGYMLLPAPTAQGALKGHTVEIYRNAEMRVIFDQLMDKQSVEMAFSVSPAVKGTFSWLDNQLTFKPDAPLDKGVTYDVTISDKAVNLYRKHLAEMFHQMFSVLDYPEVAVAAPGDNTEIRQNQTLTVLFDHPIRALNGTTTSQEKLVVLDPPIEGRTNWLGTSGFEFIPNGGWHAATDYMATVPKGTKTADGGSTVEDYIWHFSTPAPRVSLVSVTRGMKLTDPFILSFNYPIAPEAVRDGLKITKNDAVVPNDQFTFKTDDKDHSRVLVTSNTKLELGTTYRLSLPGSFTGNLGTRTLGVDWSANIVMDEKGLSIKESDPINQGSKPVYNSVRVTFNNPLDTVGAVKHVHVTPKLEEIDIHVYGAWDGEEHPNRVIDISGKWKPSTAYVVTLDGEISDIYGQTLIEKKTISFKTDQYTPSATLSSYSLHGMLAAHLPRLYQMRTLNTQEPTRTSLCSGTYEQFLKGAGFYDCNLKAEQSFETAGKLNEYKIVNMDLDAIAKKSLPNGFYKFDATIPKEVPHYAQEVITETRQFVIMDTALTLKRGNDGKLLVWATDLKTGDVVPNLTVEADRVNTDHPSNYTVENVAKGKTDAQGVAILNVSSDVRVSSIHAFDATHLGYVDPGWNDGISVWNYNLNESDHHAPGRHIGDIYTDRRIYRPDQAVQFKGVVRRDVDAKLSVPTLHDVTVKIMDSNGTEVYNQSVPLTEYGTFTGTFQLQTQMALGAYRITIQPDSIPGYDYYSIDGSFDVREYRRPDFKVDVKTPQGIVTAGTKIDVGVHSEYYQGAPLSGGTVRYEITRNRLYFQPLQGEWYNYTSDDTYSDCWWYCPVENGFEPVASGEAKLDANGNATVTIPADLTDYKFSATYNVTMTVVDVNGREVSSNTDFAVHKGDFYLGIRANYDKGWDSTSADFDIVSVNPDGSVRPAVTATVKLYKRVWSSVQKEGTDGNPSWDYQKTDTLIDTKSVGTDSQGKTSVSFSPPGDGEFVAIVETKDDRGNTVSAAADRYIYRGYDNTVQISDDHTMKILQAKADYKPGDTASLVVQTPYAQTKALVTVERDSIREYHVIDLGTKNRTVDIKIDDGAVPNEYVSVLAVKGGGDKDIPEFRMGYASLQVDTAKKVLDLHVQADKPTYKPGEQVTLTVDAKLFNGTAAQANVSVAVVDERVVSLLGSIDKNILGKFWFTRTIGVKTAQSLTQLVKKVFFETTEGGDGKGGGGPVPPIRGNFQDTAFWKADLITGADGKATATFKLPDNLTSWQILVIGATKNTEVGSAETSIVTRRDLMIEPTLPRLLRVQDDATVGGLVQNTTAHPLDVDATIQADGITIDGATTLHISIPANSRATVSWHARVPLEAPPQAKITMRVTGGGLEDGFEVPLPILPYSVPETVTASGILQKTSTESLEIPDGILKNAGELQISVAPSIGNNLSHGLEYLVDYKYGCSEQTTSAILASLAYRELATAKIAGDDKQLSDKADAKVKDGILLLQSMIRSDGGYGFWKESEFSYPFLSGYVMWALTEAQKAGYTVDQGVLDRLDGYLRSNLGYWDSSTYNSYRLNEEAQVLAMLSERNTDGLSGYAGSLYDHRDQLASFGKAFLAIAYGNIEKNASSAHAAQLLQELRNQVVYLDGTRAYVKEGGGYDYFFSSDVHSTAVYLRALLHNDPKNPDVDKVLHWLVTARKDGYWGTTYSTAMTYLTLAEYARQNPVDTNKIAVELFVDGAPKDQLMFPQGDVSPEVKRILPLPDLITKGALHQIGLEKDNDKKYFYDISMKVYRQIQDIEQFENGFTVLSDVYAVNDAKNEHPLTQVKQGDNVRVHMKLLVPKKHSYVAMEYHLPAGLEAVDFSLKTSPQDVAGQTQQCIPGWDGESYCLQDWEMGWWWESAWKHIEQRDDRVFLFSESLAPGVYEYDFIAQAVTPGDFRIPPARVYEMYNPQANAHNEGKIFKVVTQ